MAGHKVMWVAQGDSGPPPGGGFLILNAAGSPKEGDMIARNPKNHADQWLVAAQYFADNFEPVT